MVPRMLQEAVWGTYVPGQERGIGLPTKQWHAAADAAIEAVFLKESKLRPKAPRGPTLVEQRFGKK